MITNTFPDISLLEPPVWNIINKKKKIKNKSISK